MSLFFAMRKVATVKEEISYKVSSIYERVALAYLEPLQLNDAGTDFYRTKAPVISGSVRPNNLRSSGDQCRIL